MLLSRRVFDCDETWKFDAMDFKHISEEHYVCENNGQNN